ncbi:amidohydrolase family protein [Paradesulfitobacterium ferrireducens]|uniref:amidohydrolase family protein n=1 Tax=Paradesulfitobacterium ferrireducens TaxID=2816476 RepID=UPI001A8C9108|nr:amidohydrolase [Paradesulfitobacterium ferrireducens]
MGTLIYNGWVITQNEERKEYNPGYVYINRDLIEEIGDNSERLAALKAQAAELIDAAGCVVIPGLINPHTHMFQTYMRGLGDNKPLWQWLKEDIWPSALLMEEEDFYLAGLLGSLENLLSGVTHVVDQHYVHYVPGSTDAVLRAMRESGIRGTLCRGFVDQEYRPEFMETSAHIMAAMDELGSRWHGSEKERLKISLGPLNPWGCSPQLLDEVGRYSADNNMDIQIHVAETTKVVESSVSRYGLDNLTFLHQHGILSPHTQLVHGVWLNEREEELVVRTGSHLVHCPVSNMYLASGAAPVRRWLDKGINVALATDGPGSNNSEDMMETLKFAACLQRVSTLDPASLLPQDVLDMATRGGAQAVNAGNTGVLAPGYKADVVLVRMDRPHLGPVHNAVSMLTFNANGNDVDTVLVDGQVVVQGGHSTLVDEQELIQRCQAKAARIRATVTNSLSHD